VRSGSRRRPRVARPRSRLLLLGLAAAGCAAPAPPVALPGREPAELVPRARLEGRAARETSGIVRSRQWPALYWVHNDSGDEPRLYPIDRDGKVNVAAREGRPDGVLLGGATNVDWEDITTDAAGHLIVADVGNNYNNRRDLVLYYLDEPSPTAGFTTVKKKVFLRYPEQAVFPAPLDDFNYDSEAVFTRGDTVYLLTKHRSDRRTRLYRLDDPRPHETNLLTRVGEFEIGGKVTGADASPDGRELAVVTYDAVWLFTAHAGDDYFGGEVRWMPFRAPQVEGVCFDSPGLLLLSDEEAGALYEVPVEALTRLR